MFIWNNRTEIAFYILLNNPLNSLGKIRIDRIMISRFVIVATQLNKLPADSDLLPPKSENDRLRDAHEHLLSNLVNPPTIKQLS